MNRTLKTAALLLALGVLTAAPAVATPPGFPTGGRPAREVDYSVYYRSGTGDWKLYQSGCTRAQAELAVYRLEHLGPHYGVRAKMVQRSHPVP